MNTSVHCPICDAANPELLYSMDGHFVTGHLINPGNKTALNRCNAKIQDLWKGNEAAYYQCSGCGFEFAYPFVPADAEFYSLIYDSESNYPSEKWEYQISLKNIEQFAKLGVLKPRMLEIGAGNGTFVKMVSKSLISKESLFTTEYSEAGASSIEKYGITCFRSDLLQITEHDLQGKVNLVCLFQVLEHLSALHEFFNHMNELTESGSKMYISVPNIAQRKFFDRFKKHFDLPPVHIGRYNEQSLGTLAGQHGWKIVNHAIQPSSYKERVLKYIYSEYALWQRLFPSEKTSLKLLRLFLRYGIYSWLILVNIRVIIGLQKANLGTAQWFELEKIKNL